MGGVDRIRVSTLHMIDDDDEDDQSSGVVVMIIMVMMMTTLAIIVIIVRTLKRDVDRIRVWRTLELIQHLSATNGAIGRSKG